MKKLKTISLKPIMILIFISMVLIGINYLQAWQGPTQTAPNGNVSAPINVGATYQAKQGDFGAVRIRAGWYCDASGANCIAPLPICASGQVLTANASGSWICGNVSAGSSCTMNYQYPQACNTTPACPAGYTFITSAQTATWCGNNGGSGIYMIKSTCQQLVCS